MATKTAKHVNAPFPEEVRKKAFELIEAGKVLDGGFWKNRTRTAGSLGYGTWENVPENIRLCVNQIGRGARARKAAQQKPQKVVPAKMVPEDFPLTKDTLAEIHHGTLKVPRHLSPQKIEEIRTYVTVQSGFDPLKILLGIESRME
jgi:hypothetical protein